MDSVFGIVGDGFCIVAADAAAARSILVFKQDHDKIIKLDSHKIMGAAGTMADCVKFSEYIERNLKLYELNNDLKLETFETANFIRNELATALRKGPYQANLLLGGYDQGTASLYYMDYMASLAKVNFGAHGYAAAFILSVFDREYPLGGPKDVTVDVACGILRSCLTELKTRFLISQPVFVFKLVDKDGVRVITV